MHMKWMLHRMHRVRIIVDMDFHKTSLLESPIDIHILFSSRIIRELPREVFITGIDIHHVHRIFPFYRVVINHSIAHVHISHIFHSFHSHSYGDAFVWCFGRIGFESSRKSAENIVGIESFEIFFIS